MLYWQVVAMKNFDIIKEIRSRLNLSQTEFAGKLGVSFATVNFGKKDAANLRKLRWTQSSVCARTAALITHSLRATVFLSDETVTLYHGSKSGIVGEITPSSRDRCDLPPGCRDDRRCDMLIGFIVDDRMLVDAAMAIDRLKER